MERLSTPNFYAVIPATVRYAKGIPDGAKLLYGEITALCNEKGYCWASNSYFAELYSKSPDTISRWVSSLQDVGFIHCEVDKFAGNERKIYLENLTTPIRKNADTLSAKMPIPYPQKCRYNNTLNNTIKTTKVVGSENATKHPQPPASDIYSDVSEGSDSASLPKPKNEKSVAPPPTPSPRKKAETFTHAVDVPETHKEIAGQINELIALPTYRKKRPDVLAREMAWFLSCDVRYCKSQLQASLDSAKGCWQSLKYADAEQKYQEWLQRQKRLDSGVPSASPYSPDYEMPQERRASHEGEGIEGSMKTGYDLFVKEIKEKCPSLYRKGDYASFTQFSAMIMCKLYGWDDQYRELPKKRFERLIKIHERAEIGGQAASYSVDNIPVVKGKRSTWEFYMEIFEAMNKPMY